MSISKKVKTAWGIFLGLILAVFTIIAIVIATK